PTRKEGGWAQPLVIATGAEIRAIEVADLDGDALPEIIVALRGDGKSGLAIWKNTGGLRFRRMGAPGKGEVFSAIAIADFNYDGRPDIIAAKDEAGAQGGLRVWLNLGAERWQPAPAPQAAGPFHAVAAVDLNQDGVTDIVAAGSGPSGGLRAWLGRDKSLNWGRPNTISQGDFWGVTAADLNGDGILDLLAAGKNTGIQVWQGIGKGTFNQMSSPTAEGSFFRAAAVDRDSDGRADIVASTMDGKGLRFWRQDPVQGWLAQRLLPETGIYHNLIVADLDGDGRLDLGAATHGMGVAVWPGFGKALPGQTPGDKPEKHNLPLPPGARMPELVSGQLVPAPPPAAPEKIEGAFPEKRLPGEYVIGAGDVLTVSIWKGVVSQKEQVQVTERGTISLGLIDDVQAAHLTTKEVTDLLREKLKKFIKNPRVDIVVTRFGSKTVRVMGAVARPQTYNVAATVTLLDAILLAGGHLPTTAERPGGDLTHVSLRRQGGTRTVNVLRYVSGTTGEADNPELQDGDLVFVPESSAELIEQKRVYVFGEVRSPGVHPLTFNMRVLDAIARAGGFLDYALQTEVRIIRGDAERPEVVHADIEAMLKRGDRRGDQLLKPNDVVFVPRTAIGDVTDFIRKAQPILDFLFYPQRFKDAYSINANLLKFDLGGPSRFTSERGGEGTFTPGTRTVTLVGP
ncbi:MAG: FG-GAP-like repeat-containing protein, partial [Nitrospinota bacterium]